MGNSNSNNQKEGSSSKSKFTLAGPYNVNRVAADAVDDIPPQPKNAMRFVCLSDTHNKLSSLKIPNGDVILHAGDFSSTGYLNLISNAFLKKKKKILKFVEGECEKMNCYLLCFDENLILKKFDLHYFHYFHSVFSILRFKKTQTC